MRLARFGLTTAALSLLYFLLTNLVYSKLPYLSVPSQWVWPSRVVALVTWFQLLNVTGALVAALPVALFIALRVADAKLRMALLIGAITTLATFVFSGTGQGPTSSSAPSWALWINEATLDLALVLATPVLVRLIIALPSNNRWRGP